MRCVCKLRAGQRALAFAETRAASGGCLVRHDVQRRLELSVTAGTRGGKGQGADRQAGGHSVRVVAVAFAALLVSGRVSTALCGCEGMRIAPWMPHKEGGGHGGQRGPTRQETCGVPPDRHPKLLLRRCDGGKLAGRGGRATRGLARGQLRALRQCLLRISDGVGTTPAAPCFVTPQAVAAATGGGTNERTTNDVDDQAISPRHRTNAVHRQIWHDCAATAQSVHRSSLIVR